MDKQGDVLIRVLWEIQTDAIIGVIFGDSEADTYRNEPMDKLLDCWKKDKKDKHGKNFHKQQKHFLRFYSQWMACSGRRP